MFGFITRLLGDRQADIRRRALMAQQDARIAAGFGALRTAVELVGQSAAGRGPSGEVVEIGDGFYVEQYADGSRRTVVLDKAKVQSARLDSFVAHVDRFPAPPPDADFTGKKL